MIKKLSLALIIAIIFTAIPVFSVDVNAVTEETITAPSAVLMETSSGKILFEKNPHEQRPCASITKVMTMLLVCEAIDNGKLSLDDTITASAHAASMGGSDIWLEEGETMSADDMIKATVVASANDAAIALAEHLCGSEEVFVEKMNEKASQLGMKDTVFKNCNGLDEDGHITSAYDVAVMSRELMKHEMIFDYTSIWLDNLRDGKTQIVNTNKLLKTYNGITGLKTGTTNDAGCCMSASAKRGDMNLVAVVLGCNSGKERFSDAAALLDYGFANFSVTQLKAPEDLPKTIKVENGMQGNIGIGCDVNASIVLDKNSSSKIVSKIDLPESIEAPVVSGQKLGTVTYSLDGNAVKSFEITALQDAEKISFASVFSVLLNSIISL
ncbi:D-alanyl-D-alanine carboxypeptidase family protein [uncultured Ruminococcus sp.]|jgi:D-alanyl-D-alanine carboxypeptidase (penicillin-binding protein 5/6)|uniref:D-alanyl-D-alanine carboxypeptidase family protein n=1 Tax=uncultured Ruminococcus sp. TaxID=165186 RepID=UPI00266F1B0D|nr:D-alanyl-D-alanine carboxypeptidase family protein [uncultured Ruminococcus sp.]